MKKENDPTRIFILTFLSEKDSFWIWNFHRLFLKDQTLRVKNESLYVVPLFYIRVLWPHRLFFQFFLLITLSVEAMEWSSEMNLFYSESLHFRAHFEPTFEYKNPGFYDWNLQSLCFSIDLTKGPQIQSFKYWTSL